MFVQRLLLLLFVISFGLLAQAPAGSPPGSIDGRVTNSQTGDGVSGATVRLAPMRVASGTTPAPDLTVTTAADGGFHLDNVAPGTYFAVVQGTGFVGSYSRATLRSISVSAGQQVTNITITMMPQGIISGKVIDDEGNGQSGAHIEAFLERPIRGAMQVFRSGQTNTDKSGNYSLRGLPPGKYYLAAEISDKPPTKSSAPDGHPASTNAAAAPSVTQAPKLQLVRTYYPRSLDLDNAIPVDVQAGQDFSGTNIELRRVQTHYIRGKIEGLSGTSVRRDALFLSQRAGVSSLSSGRRGKVSEDGEFDFEAILPGEYTLRLIGTPPNDSPGGRTSWVRQLLARQDVEVGASDIDGLNLVMIPSVNLTGRVTADGFDAPNFSGMQITLAPTASDASFGSYRSTKIGADGTFTLENLSPVEYVVHALGGPAGTYIKSLTFNGEDLLTQPMDLSQGGGGEITVTLHSGVAEVDGTVQTNGQLSEIPLASGTGGQAASPYPMVVLVPTKAAPDGSGLLAQPVQPSGAFVMQNVRPGQYTAFAVERFDGSLWQNPSFLKEIQSEGIGVDVAENDHKQIQLSTISNDEIQQASIRAGIQQ
jgi:hypothetical protein